MNIKISKKIQGLTCKRKSENETKKYKMLIFKICLVMWHWMRQNKFLGDKEQPQ